MVEFFVSYTSADADWAQWIAFVLEEEGFSVTLQAWDFRPGSNFVIEMQSAAARSDRTIMVLSPAYLKSQFASPEWAAAFAQDPQGLARKLIPVMIRRCTPEGMLASIVHIDISGKDEIAAREALVKGLANSRAKPVQRPAFPGLDVSSAQPKSFPGVVSTAVVHRQTHYLPEVKRIPTDAEKRRFSREAFETIREYFRDGLEQLQQRLERADLERAETDFQVNSSSDFTAEIFLNGKSQCRTRIRIGGFHSPDGIVVSDGASYLSDNSANEILSISDNPGQLSLKALFGTSFRPKGTADINLNNMSADHAAEYLWFRFLSNLSRTLDRKDGEVS